MMTKDTAPRPASLSKQDEARWHLVLDQVAHGYVLFDDAITEFADADVVHGIARLIALRLELETDIVMWALDADSDEPVTVLCRAAALNINVFSAVLRMRRRRRSSDLSPSETLNAFRRLSRDTARRALRAAPYQALRRNQ